MKKINLVDNRRYVLDKELKGNNVLFRDKTYYISEDFLRFFRKFPNPFTTEHLEGVEFIEQKADREFETLVFKIVTKNGETYLQTGNMIGEFYFKEKRRTKEVVHKINIGLRFDEEGSTEILEYLVNYANAIYPDKVEIGSKNNKQNKTNSIVKVLLSNMFTHSLSKAHVMGLPTIYRELKEKDFNVRGRIDVNRLISQEIPFKGKTPYIRNEKMLVQSIALVILKAINIIQHNVNSSLPNLSQIKNSIKQIGIKGILNSGLLKEALNHKVLSHPSFYEYKNTLYLASLIIKGFKIPTAENMQGVFYGYLVDVSKLWENFLAKYLEQNLSQNWKVLIEPSLKLFKNRPNLYELTNVMYPDLVLLNEVEKKVVVLDAKFKNSKWFNREDFYKTAAYISYYQNQGYSVLSAGQIYPDKNADKINESLGYLDSEKDFRIFGLDILEEILKNKESDFIKVMREICGE